MSVADLTLDFETPAAGTGLTAANTGFSAWNKSASATAVIATDKAYSGTKSARLTCPTTGTDFAFGAVTGMSDSARASQVAIMYETLPSPGSTIACKLLAMRNSTTNACQVRIGGTATSSGNVFQMLDAGSAVLGTSPAITVGRWYLIELIGVPGASTTTGRVAVQIWEDGSLFYTVDVSTVNVGTTPLVEDRAGKIDTTTVFDGRMDFYRKSSGATTFIGLPSSVQAVASAGADQFLEPFANWQGAVGTAGDGAAARASLSASGTQYSGGTPTYAWSGPAGVTFTAPNSVNTDVILPQGIVDTTYTLTVTVTVPGAPPSVDTVDVKVRASDVAWLRSDGVWRPARFVAL